MKETTGKKEEQMVCIIKRALEGVLNGCGLDSCSFRQRGIAGCFKYLNQDVDLKKVIFAV